MAVNQDREFSTGLYTPFRGFDREAGAIGTYSLLTTAAGTVTAGTVTITVQMNKIEFGFHPIFIITRISTRDELAAAEVILFSYLSDGNERLQGIITEQRLSVALAAGGDFIATFTELGVSIEPTEEVATRDAFQVRWGTNTDGKTYTLSVFGVLYDAEALARAKLPGKAPDLLLTGVR